MKQSYFYFIVEVNREVSHLFFSLSELPNVIRSEPLPTLLNSSTIWKFSHHSWSSVLWAPGLRLFCLSRAFSALTKVAFALFLGMVYNVDIFRGWAWSLVQTLLFSFPLINFYALFFWLTFHLKFSNYLNLYNLTLNSFIVNHTWNTFKIILCLIFFVFHILHRAKYGGA